MINPYFLYMKRKGKNNLFYLILTVVLMVVLYNRSISINKIEFYLPMVSWIAFSVPLIVAIDEVNFIERTSNVYNKIIYMGNIDVAVRNILQYVSIKVIIFSVIEFASVFLYFNFTSSLFDKNSVVLSEIIYIWLKSVCCLPLIAIMLLLVFQKILKVYLRNFAKVVINFFYMFLLMLSGVSLYIVGMLSFMILVTLNIYNKRHRLFIFDDEAM